MYGLEEARLFVCVSLVDLSSFALLPKKVFPPLLGVREGREGNPGTPTQRRILGHEVCSLWHWIF